MKRVNLKLVSAFVAPLAAVAFGASALASPAPPVASIADHHEEATLVFDVGKGAKVHVVGAGGGQAGSNCTNHETGILRTTTSDREADKISFTAKSGGSCGVEESWSNFHMSVRGPGSFYGEGTVFLGQKAIAGGYAVYCDMRVGNHYNQRWDHLHCSKVNHRELTITKS